MRQKTTEQLTILEEPQKRSILGRSKEQESATAFYEMASRCSRLQDGLVCLMFLVVHRTLLIPIPFQVTPSLYRCSGSHYFVSAYEQPRQRFIFQSRFDNQQ